MAKSLAEERSLLTRPAPNPKALLVAGAGVIVAAAVVVEIAGVTAEAVTNRIRTAPIWRDLDRGRKRSFPAPTATQRPSYDRLFSPRLASQLPWLLLLLPT